MYYLAMSINHIYIYNAIHINKPPKGKSGLRKTGYSADKS